MEFIVNEIEYIITNFSGSERLNFFFLNVIILFPIKLLVDPMINENILALDFEIENISCKIK